LTEITDLGSNFYL